MEPKDYFSSELWEERRSDAALFIQRIVRGMLARRRAKALLNQKEEKLRKQKEHDQKTRTEEESNQKSEIARRLNPKSHQDFKMLVDELEHWRKKEIA